MNRVIEKLKSKMREQNIDLYLLPTQDEFLGEYVPDHGKRLEYMTNFTGSNGMALFNSNGQDYFYTDGRYLIQASKQLSKDFQISDMKEHPITKMVQSLTSDGLILGIDPKLHNIIQIESFLKHVPNEQIVFVETNLVDEIWEARPQKVCSQIDIHPLEFAGEEHKSKKSKILKEFKEGLDSVVITNPHSVCWLLNIRGRDLDYTPIVLSRAILYKNGSVELFCDNPISKEVEDYFHENDISLKGSKEFETSINKLQNKVSISKSSSYWLKMMLAEALVESDYCEYPKAIKNSAEIKGARTAHEKDGKAVTKLLQWVKDSVEKGEKITEYDVLRKSVEFRGQQENFVAPSFPTIAGFKENGAIVHYKPGKESKTITGSGLLLIDSGGQYFEGTTDITRTIPIGKPTKDQIHDFTLVLKGYIALASAEFKHGTTGAELDKLARQYLQQEEKDYSHGTGHGVGSFLSVHEGPQSISPVSKVPLDIGMIVSIEPGYYKEGEYGIRIESLALVKECSYGALGFELLTKVPISKDLIDFDMLNGAEKEFVESYNKLCVI